MGNGGAVREQQVPINEAHTVSTIPTVDLVNLRAEVERLREAAKQALDTLESLQGGCTDAHDGTVEAITVWCPEIIEALHNALKETK
jgi:hypothetical protein